MLLYGPQALRRVPQYQRRESRRSVPELIRYFTSEGLLVSVMFYAAAAMLVFGAFCTRYRLELILGFPTIAFVMAVCLHVALKDYSAVQNPENLYREPWLMLAVMTSALQICALPVVDLPAMQRVLTPTASTDRGGVGEPFSPRIL